MAGKAPFSLWSSHLKEGFRNHLCEANISNSLLDPRSGADSLEVLEKELAWFILLTLTNIYVEWRFRGILSYYLQILAAVEVDIVLPAVPGLVHVRKSRVKGDSLLQRVLNNLGHHRRMQKNSGNIEEIHLLLDNVSEI